MHELGVARRLVAEALERMGDEGGQRVATVDVVLGVASHLSEGSVRQHFELAARGTPVDGAVLHVTWAPARYRCFDCLFEFAARERGADAACPRCGGTAVSLGRESLAYVRTITVGGG
jgi:hydrogenase nickel incorporation protein HypA/HybF